MRFHDVLRLLRLADRPIETLLYRQRTLQVRCNILTLITIVFQFHTEILLADYFLDFFFSAHPSHALDVAPHVVMRGQALRSALASVDAG